VESSARDKGWVTLSYLGRYIIKIKSNFDPRTFGFKQLGLLFDALPDDFEYRSNNSGSVRVKN